MSNPLFVLDTNTLISALLISSSVSRAALQKADDLGRIVFSKETLAELNSTLVRSKFDKYVNLDDRLHYIERLEARGLIVSTTSTFTDCRDVKDNMFLNIAYDAKATYIISGDKDLLVLHPFHDISIISASDFIATTIA